MAVFYQRREVNRRMTWGFRRVSLLRELVGRKQCRVKGPGKLSDHEGNAL